jgi:hypothetical protein
MDVTVKIGVGNNEKDKQVFALNGVLQNYQIMAQANLFGIIFNKDNIYKALIDLAKAQGLEFPEIYYQNPNSQQAIEYVQQQQNQPQQPDIQTQLVQLQAQIESQKIQLQSQELELKKIKQEQDHEIEMIKLNFEKQKQEQDYAINIEKLKQSSSKLDHDKNMNILVEARNAHESLERNAQSYSKKDNFRVNSQRDKTRKLNAAEESSI